MKVVKITDRLWRLYNGTEVKDCWVKNGVLLPPCGEVNQLTDKELAFAEAEIKKNK